MKNSFSVLSLGELQAGTLEPTFQLAAPQVRNANLNGAASRLGAKGQRRSLVEALRDDFPRDCRKYAPCSDGRCPICGIYLERIFSKALNSSEAKSRRWRRYAYAIRPEAPARKTACSLHSAHKALKNIAAALTRPGFVFVGTYGWLWDDSSISQVPAFEFVCTEVRWATEKIERALGGKSRASFLKLVSPDADRHLDRLALPVGLLQGYLRFSSATSGPYRNIKDECLLRDIAMSYGRHRIADRIIVKGIFNQINSPFRLVPLGSYDGYNQIGL